MVQVAVPLGRLPHRIRTPPENPHACASKQMRPSWWLALSTDAHFSPSRGPSITLP